MLYYKRNLNVSWIGKALAGNAIVGVKEKKGKGRI